MNKLWKFLKKNVNKVVAMVMVVALLSGNVVTYPKAATFPTDSGGNTATLTYSNYFSGKTTAYTSRFGNHSMQKMRLTALNGTSRAAFCIAPGVGTYPGGQYTSSTVIDASKAKYYRAAISFYYKEGKDAGYGDDERRAMTQAFMWFISKNRADASTFKSDTVSVFSEQGICSSSVASNMYDLAKEVIIDNADNYTAQDVTIVKWTSSNNQTVLTGKVNEEQERYYRIKVEKTAVKKDGKTELKDANLAGIKYTLYTTEDGNTKVKDRNGNNISITLNEKGNGYSKYIEFDESKEVNTVWLAETSVKPGTELNETRKRIRINKEDIPDGEKITVTEETSNDAWYVYFEVEKTDGDTKDKLSGAKFAVLEWNGRTYVETGDTFITDEDGFGESTVEHYYTTKNGGKFMLKEIEAPPGYPVVNLSKKFTITEATQYDDHVIDWSAENHSPDDGSITVYKIDQKTKEPIPTGAQFHVYKLVTDADGNYIDATTGEPFSFSPSIGDAHYKKEDCGLMTNVGNGVYKMTGLKKNEKYRVYEEKSPSGYEDPWIFNQNNAQTSFWYTKGYYDAYVTSSTPDVVYTWENTPLSLTLKINKKDSKNNDPIEGAVFDLYEKMTDGSEVMLAEGITDAEGKIIFNDIRVGGHDVILKEVYAPEGYILDPTPVTIKNEEIAKAGEDSFIYTHEYSMANGSLVGDMVRIPNGKAYIEKDITNEPVEKTIKIHKISKNRTGKEVKNIEGAEFSIYEIDGTVLTESNYETFDRYEELTPVDVLVTDKDGNATSKSLPIAQYAVVETKAPKNYLKANPVLVEIDDSEGSSVDVEIEDNEFESRLKVIKKDADTGEIVPRAGARFKILDKSTNSYVKQTIYYFDNPENPDEASSFETIDTYTTDKTGTVILPEVLAVGSYELQEVEAPVGYLLNEEPVPFTIDDEMEYEFDESTQDPIIEVVMKDKGKTGKISITKKGDSVTGYDEENGFTYDFKSLEGAEFEIVAAEDIYMADTVTKAYTKGEVADTLKTDKDGNALSKALLPGKYTVKETKVPDGFYDAKIEQDVVLSYEESDASLNVALTITNHKQDVKVTVYKKEEDSNKLLAGATFGIYAKNDIVSISGDVLFEKDSLIEQKTTDERGYVVFGEDKDYPVADYYVKELSAPKGYKLSKDTILAEIVGSPSSTQVITKEYVMYNKPTEVKVSKVDITGDNEVEGATLEVWYLDENGERVIADTWVSGKTTHIIKGLEVGREYTLTEKIPARGYVTAADVKFTVVDEDEVQGVVMVDDHTKVEISKVDITTGEPVIGAKLEIKDSDGNVIESWITEKDPHYIEKLPIGKYTLVETLAPFDQGYVTATEIEFEIKDTGDLQKVVMKDDYTKAEFSKVDITTGDPVVGAELEIRDAENKVVASWVTTDKPYYIEKLPVGKYTLVEKLAPFDQGYVTATSVEFEIKDSDVIQKVEMKDDYTKVDISKTDITGKEPVSGAKLQVIDESGKVIEEWISTDEPHRIERIPVGNYVLREVLAPKGYVRAEDVKFTVSDSGEIVKVVMKDAESVGRIMFTKVDADNESKTLEGAEFGIYDENDNQIATVKTDKNGIAKSNYLELDDEGNGIFYVKELKAPIGYQLDDTKRKVEIKYTDDTMAVITVDLGKIKNKKKKVITTPLTGVTSSPIPYVVFGLSGICLATVFFYKRKRRNA